MSVYRVYVEKKAPFAVEAQGVLSDIHSSLGIGGVTGVRILNRYDVEDITPEDFELAKKTILSEPQVDEVYDELPAFGAQDKVFAVQFLPGQFDQRADSAVQCIQLATQHDRPTGRLRQGLCHQRRQRRGALPHQEKPDQPCRVDGVSAGAGADAAHPVRRSGGRCGAGRL